MASVGGGSTYVIEGPRSPGDQLGELVDPLIPQGRRPIVPCPRGCKSLRHALLSLARPRDGRPDRAERDVDAAALLVDDEAEAGPPEHPPGAAGDLWKT